jgi:hypothetical protein
LSSVSGRYAVQDQPHLTCFNNEISVNNVNSDCRLVPEKQLKIKQVNSLIFPLIPLVKCRKEEVFEILILILSTLPAFCAFDWTNILFCAGRFRGKDKYFRR